MNAIIQPVKAISKILSGNDTGETGSHQAGMLIPKSNDILSFFPKLEPNIKNPRAALRFIDDTGGTWIFNFIYYNNRFFDGTRNEYRLTGMTSFIKQNDLTAGDTITLTNITEGRLCISYARTQNSPQPDEDILVLGTAWKVIKI